MKKLLWFSGAFLLVVAMLWQCKTKSAAGASSEDAAQKAYVAPGKYDEFYNFVSGGFNGQVRYTAFLPAVCLKSSRCSPNSPKTAMATAKRPNPCS